MKHLKVLIIFLLLFGLAIFVYRKFTESVVPTLNGPHLQNTNEPVLTTQVPGQDLLSEGILDGGPPREKIQAIDQPTFQSITAAGGYLRDSGQGILLRDEESSRFYPFQILVWHEVVNDDLKDGPVAVTYNPLTGSVLVFKRIIDGAAMPRFSVTSKVFNDNALLTWDRQNLLSQLNAQVISGPLRGRRLEIIPSDIITWQAFKLMYPSGLVLTRPPDSKNDYTFDPYGDYYTSGAVYYPVTTRDERFPAKTNLHGVIIGGVPKAYINSKVEQRGLINDEISGTPVVIWVDQNSRAIRIFSRSAGQRTLSFEYAGHTLFDHQTNSHWNFDGQAVDGKLKGTKLVRIQDMTAYWYFWYAFYPSTIVWGL